jgi:hypothetical protein
LPLKTFLKYLLLPLLVAAYPVLFLFGNNASALGLGSLTFPIGASLLVAGAVYAFFSLILRKPLTASLSAAAFMILYYLYGFIYHMLVKWNRFPVRQSFLLPLVIALAVGIAYLLSRVKPAVSQGIQRVLLVGSTALVVYNLFGVVAPVEAQKILASRSTNPVLPVTTAGSQKKPDIYYIILDEYAGIDSTRSYWHDTSINDFETFLKQNNFFVATEGRSPTLNTGSEIASRLNLQTYPETLPNQVKMDAIDHNKVMQILKSKGYTTVAIDMAFQGIQADVNVQYDPEEVGGMAADEFQKTYLDATMFNPFSSYFRSNNQAAIKQRDIILYALEKTTNPGNIKSPKFVFTHVLLPHEPFIFDKDGNLLPAKASDDWTYYLGQHQYTTKLAEQLISKLLANADPSNPPVIILQSDHGARNLATKAADGTILNHLLPNFTSKNMHDILNAMYLPGFDTRQLSNSMDPTETFAIVLNHYFNAGVQVEKTPAK